jgi:hypothetical protein
MILPAAEEDSMAVATATGLWVELITGSSADDVDAFYADGRLDAIRSTPGIGRVRRLHEPNGPRHLLLADLLGEVEDPRTSSRHLRGPVAEAHPLDGLGAPQTRTLVAMAVPQAVHGIAREGDEGPLKFLVAMAVNPIFENEYNRWYDAEHIPILMRHDGWLGARRYRCESPVSEYLTIYEAGHQNLLSPAAQADVRSTHWSRDVLSKAFMTHTRGYFAPVAD